ncbi:mechanosensitive ion channel domain-containing protein [Olsenella sp. Marseille-QA0557]|uniref:mechanosensitive ion channel domain-containing protein n=1 Tax=Olsenella sp. Marseille-QA0557 TaxID=3378782 RepID=UPI003D09C154
MSQKLKHKIVLLTLVVIVAALISGFLLYRLQLNLTLASYEEEMSQKAESLTEILETASNEAAESKKTFDEIYQSKAESVSFMAQNDAGFEATDAKMDELKQLLEVDNILVVQRDGTIIAEAEKTQADFSSARFNYLRKCFSTHEASRAVEIELPDQNWLMRYYAARLDDKTMVVIEQNPAELRELIEKTDSTASVLRDVSVGQDGYIFALSAQTYVVEYHPDESLIGTDALSEGIDVENLEDGFTGWLNLAGKRIYAHVALIGNTYYICAVPESALTQTASITVAVILFVLVAVMATVALYGVFVMHADEKDGDNEEEFRDFGVFRYHKTVGKRTVILSLVGCIAVAAVSFYMQTLFSLSAQSVTNKARAEDIAETIERTDEQAKELTEQYNRRYLSKARVAAYILEKNPKLANKQDMQELANVLQVANVYLFDGSGSLIASNAPYEHFQLSDDPEDQSYPFHQLLTGVDEYVQEPMNDEMTGELKQYVGVATYDNDGYVDGFVQIGIRASRLESLLQSVQIDTVLEGVQIGSNGFAFAINKDDKTIASFPNPLLVGAKATDAGLTENQIRGGYDDYLTIDGSSYFASSIETPDYYLYVAGPEGEPMAQRIPLTITITSIAVICMCVVFCVVTLERKNAPQIQASASDTSDKPDIFDIETPSGRMARTESAASRWLNKSLAWDDMTPEQKLSIVLKFFMSIGVIAIFLSVLFQKQIFDSESVFGYILGGGWERGLNIFAITAAIMTACVIFTISWIIQRILHLLSSILSARGETVCRLLLSLTKYGSILGTLYWTLSTIGVDTATLLASAGLLTLAISFGAKDLVTDLLCGLFIIFEGEFRVGDRISVGSNTGTVMEIGIRTTKINDGDGNVIVLRNSAISNVINRTKMDSYASVDIEITVGEDLPYLETILKKELPRIAGRQPLVLDGPFYKGVVALSTSTMTLRIVARCNEKDRGALERNLKREMRLMLTRYNIAPYQEQFIHTDAEENVRTLKDDEELQEADDFVKSQSSSSKDIGNDNK